MRATFIGMDPPKHDRLKALFQAGFTPKRIAAHEDEIRAIVTEVLDRLSGRETCDLVTDVAQPAVAHVIGSFIGIPAEDDEIWAKLTNSTLGASDPDLGEKLEEHEIVMGFFLLVAAGNDSTKAIYCSGMRALIENPDQRRPLLQPRRVAL